MAPERWPRIGVGFDPDGGKTLYVVEEGGVATMLHDWMRFPSPLYVPPICPWAEQNPNGSRLPPKREVMEWVEKCLKTPGCCLYERKRCPQRGGMSLGQLLEVLGCPREKIRKPCGNPYPPEFSSTQLMQRAWRILSQFSADELREVSTGKLARTIGCGRSTVFGYKATALDILVQKEAEAEQSGLML